MVALRCDIDTFQKALSCRSALFHSTLSLSVFHLSVILSPPLATLPSLHTSSTCLDGGSLPHSFPIVSTHRELFYGGELSIWIQIPLTQSN